MIRSEWAAQIKAFAGERGFDLCRIAPAGAAPHAEFFRKWLDRGDAADMRYLHRFADRRDDPAKVVNGAPPQSIVVLAADYYQGALPKDLAADPSRGIIASYAWGADYHDIIKPALYDVDAFIRSLSGRREQAKCLVDTGPILERDWALAAGLGFTGKNCCTIHPERGSWLFLATILVPEKLSTDGIAGDPFTQPADRIIGGVERDTHFGFWQLRSAESGASVTGSCGACTRCMDACPTDAFVGPFHLDSRRCISYWTIETQAAIPVGLRPSFGNRIFGCDICQDVCPWNANLPTRKPRLAALSAIADRVAPKLLDGFEPSHPYWLVDEAFQRQFSRSPVLRATREGMLRNVCVALGNWASREAVPALESASRSGSPIVREHARWALARIGVDGASGDRGDGVNGVYGVYGEER